MPTVPFIGNSATMFAPDVVATPKDPSIGTGEHQSELPKHPRFSRITLRAGANEHDLLEFDDRPARPDSIFACRAAAICPYVERDVPQATGFTAN
jgi:hypothetical protein